MSVRRKTTNSVNATAYDTVNPNIASPDLAATVYLRGLPAQQQVFDAVGERARTTFEYDNYVRDAACVIGQSCLHDALVSRAAISGQCDGTSRNCPDGPNFGSQSYLARGNVTKTTRYLLDPSGNGAVISSTSGYSQYDVAGNVVKLIDPRSTPTNVIATNIDFSDCFGAPNAEARTNTVPAELNAQGRSSFAFVTRVTNALSQTAYSQYDFYTGHVVDAEDRNGIVSSGYYNDALDRPTQVIRAANQDTTVKSQTTFSYDDTNRIITTASDQNSFNDPNPLKSQVVYDGSGRTVETRAYENSTQYITVKQIPFIIQQDPDTGAWVAASQSSNPFRSYSPYNEQPVWTTKFIDALGRTTKVRTPDNAIARTTYSGNAVTVSDQANKQRKSATDGLGRLTQVIEDPNGLNYLTNYTYDALDDLTGVSQYDPVSQVTQTRTFVFDSLKRLVSATNPESGMICHGTLLNGQCQRDGYDANGNLLYKRDARGVVTTFGTYDALNRPTTKSYSDGTPSVTYFYDSQLPSGAPSNFTSAFATGRLSAVTYGGNSAGDYYSYDAGGRVDTKFQQTGGVNYKIGPITYNRAGAVTAEPYPSGRTVNYGYDAAGRANSFSGNLGGNQRTYASEILYSPFGGLSKEKFGTDTQIYNKLFYNVRGQLAEIREGTSYSGPTDTGWERGAIINHYSNNYGCWGASCNAPDNNGNLMKQDIYVRNPDSSQSQRTQYYSYDSLNRLKQVYEDTYVPAYNWQQAYNYDRWGNRTIDLANTSNVSVPTWNFGVDPNTNRLTAPAGYSMGYDSAGNLTSDTTTGQGLRTYDAENRMITANNGADVYTYDGDAHRVKRNVNGSVTLQVYGVSGELLAEYSSNGNLQKEYGYRNGQLLVTATVTSGSGGSPYNFTDNPVVAGSTTIKAVYLTELRAAVDQARAHAGLAHATWTDDPAQANTTLIRAVYITELRTALDQARAALGLSQGGYTDPTLYVGTTTIKAAHINELRTKTNEALTTVTGSSVDVRWLVSDQLGTPRMVFDQSGSLASTVRHDYLPFGEELPGGPLNQPGAGGRVTTQGYTADSVRQKFTLQERDNETGLDYMHARYYGNAQGRFTGVDRISGSVGDPQSWNGYAYVGNDPLNATDPTGMAAYSPYASIGKGGEFYQGSFLRREIGIYGDAENASYVETSETVSVSIPWPPEIHDLIIAQSLPELNAADLKAIQEGSREVDWGSFITDQGEKHNTLKVAQAYLHAMVPVTWVKEYGLEKATQMAIDAAAKFTRDELELANNFMRAANRSVNMELYTDNRRKALLHFGMAMHPHMDAMSPMHQWKVYDPAIEPFTLGYEMYEHHKGENRAPNSSEMSVMRQQIRMFFSRTFGSFSP